MPTGRIIGITFLTTCISRERLGVGSGDGCQASRCYLRIGGGWWFCPATFFCATAYGRIDQEITKVREKIAEYQEKLKALEAQKTEAENLEIVQMVRALRMTPAQLSAMLSGGTVPGSLADDNNEQEENSYEE